jgi:hypothetical protein
MPTYQGYIEDGWIVPIDMSLALNGRQVAISVLESDSGKEIPYTKSSPQRDTLECLFNDYDGTSFQTEIVDLGAPTGNEKW